MLPELSPEDNDAITTSSKDLQPTLAIIRNPALDILRGVAVLGALFISIWIFGGFSTIQQNELLLQSKGGNYRLWGAMELLLDGKMRALICIVFGAGMVIFLSQKTEQVTTALPDLFIRRQLWLLGFGLLNALVFLWTGDILFQLAVVGILLFPFVRMNPRALWISATVVTLIYCGKIYWNYADDRTAYAKHTAVLAFEKKISKDSLLAAEKKIPLKELKKDSLSAQQKEDKAAWEGIVQQHKHDLKAKDNGVKEVRNAEFGKIWDHFLQATQGREARWTYQTGVWDVGGMMLLGMALFKKRFFETNFPKSRYLLLGIACIAVGILLGWYRLQFQQYALRDYTKYVIGHWTPFNLLFPLERAFLTVGYAAGILFLFRSGLLRFVWTAFEKVGKLALTNYLFQSIFCLVFFTGFGMGYFGRLQQYQLFLFALEICIVQIVFSVFWLRYFTYGPAEWLLRCLMHWKWLPIKTHNKKSPASALPIHL